MEILFPTSQPSPLRAAALGATATGRPGEALRGAGLWCPLPEGEHSVTVSIEGDSVGEGLLVPTVLSLEPATTRPPREPDPWRGHALYRTRDGRWVSHAIPWVSRGDALRRALVLRLPLRCEREGEGTLRCTLTVAGLGRATVEQRVRVGEGATRDDARVILARRDTFAASDPELARWLGVDQGWRRLARRVGATRLLMRARELDRGEWVLPEGGDAWERALRSIARGRLCTLAIDDPEGRMGMQLTAGTRRYRRPHERLLWAEARSVGATDPAREERFLAGLAQGAAPPGDRVETEIGRVEREPSMAPWSEKPS